MLAAKQAGPISMASGSGSQLGSGVLPRPRLALLEAQAFKKQRVFYPDSKESKDRQEFII